VLCEAIGVRCLPIILTGCLFYFPVPRRNPYFGLDLAERVPRAEVTHDGARVVLSHDAPPPNASALAPIDVEDGWGKNAYGAGDVRSASARIRNLAAAHGGNYVQILEEQAPGDYDPKHPCDYSNRYRINGTLFYIPRYVTYSLRASDVIETDEAGSSLTCDTQHRRRHGRASSGAQRRRLQTSTWCVAH